MGEPNWRNRTLFHHDNLAVLRGMDSETVDLIATDPPFNKGRDFHATPDSLAAGAKFQDRWSWEKDVLQPWVDQITDDYPRLMEAIESARYAHSDGMGAYMCFMAVRLLEMRRVLKGSGTIYVHCDHTAGHYLKAVMDAVFGSKRFLNEIVWCYRGGGVPKSDFARKHDTIFRYSKGDTVTFNVDAVRIPYSASVLESSASRYDKSYRSNKVYSGYRPNEDGKHPEDWWEIQPLMPSDKKERTGFKTQKPLTLYERIIRASSKRNDIVLDPFAGCATTCVAAERLGRQWVGIDIWEGAHRVVIERLKTEGLLQEAEGGGADHLAFGDIHYATKPPARTDGGEIAAPFLRVMEKRQRPPLEGWQKLSRAEIVRELVEAQSITEGLVLCAGCGRELEAPFMELDHIQPRAGRGENDISNRILLCRPCNGRKGAKLTMPGLLADNRKAGWMKDEGRAKHAQALAQERYEDIRYRRHWPATTGNLFD